MKKALALVLALVFAFAMSTMAFAADSDITGAVNDIVDYANGLLEGADADIIGTVEDAAVGALEALANLDLKALDTDNIAGAIDGLRDSLESVGISTSSGTISDLIDNLKGTIKDFYAPNSEEPTVPEVQPETGSSATTGIAVFAAVSVAAAAAYVCTKKKVA